MSDGLLRPMTGPAGRAAPASSCSRSAVRAPPTRARTPGARARRESRARARSRARPGRASRCRRRRRGLPPKAASCRCRPILDHHQAPGASAGVLERRFQRRELRLALKQRRLAAPGHGLRLPQGESRVESRVPPGCRSRGPGADAGMETERPDDQPALLRLALELRADGAGVAGSLCDELGARHPFHRVTRPADAARGGTPPKQGRATGPAAVLERRAGARRPEVERANSHQGSRGALA